ncbi:hypothetical protein ACFE04_012888 [Oxalis oulophora]
MAAANEEETTKLSYIPEVILKKRKSKDNNEALAILRRNQLQLGKNAAAAKKRKAADVIKRPEDFVLEFRAKEMDFVQMKHRVKRAKKTVIAPNSNLIFIVRIQGKNDMHPKTRKALYSLRLRKVFDGVFVKASEGMMLKLQKVEPYVTYGYPNLKSVKDLIYKKGYALIDSQRIPLTDNIVIEQALGKYGIVCIEDIVHEISSVGPHFIDVIRFLGPFALNKPEGLRGSKKRFKDGGDTGNREDDINDLINSGLMTLELPTRRREFYNFQFVDDGRCCVASSDNRVYPTPRVLVKAHRRKYNNNKDKDKDKDPWLAADKLYHILFCFSLSLLFSTLSSLTHHSFLKRHSIIIGSTISLLAGAAKETADHLHIFPSAGASAKDAVSDVIGVILAAFLLVLWKKKKKKQKGAARSGSGERVLPV